MNANDKKNAPGEGQKNGMVFFEGTAKEQKKSDLNKNFSKNVVKRDAFVFYRSFSEAISGLPDDARLAVYDAIVGYGLNAEYSTCTNDPVVNGFLCLIKPQIDANNRRYENGCKGGRPRKADDLKGERKPNKNQTETKPKPKEKDKDKDKDKDIIMSDFDRFWLLYDKKVGKRKTEKLYFELSSKDREQIFTTLPAYVQATPNKKFRKDPATYINNRCWEDEIVTSGTQMKNEPVKIEVYGN